MPDDDYGASFHSEMLPVIKINCKDGSTVLAEPTEDDIGIKEFDDTSHNDYFIINYTFPIIMAKNNVKINGYLEAECEIPYVYLDECIIDGRKYLQGSHIKSTVKTKPIDNSNNLNTMSMIYFNAYGNYIDPFWHQDVCKESINTDNLYKNNDNAMYTLIKKYNICNKGVFSKEFIEFEKNSNYHLYNAIYESLDIGVNFVYEQDYDLKILLR